MIEREEREAAEAHEAGGVRITRQHTAPQETKYMAQYAVDDEPSARRRGVGRRIGMTMNGRVETGALLEE